MDYELILSHLKLARKHVVVGEKLVINQRALVRRLEEDGHDTSEAKLLLAQFEELHQMHVADVERLGKRTA